MSKTVFYSLNIVFPDNGQLYTKNPSNAPTDIPTSHTQFPSNSPTDIPTILTKSPSPNNTTDAPSPLNIIIQSTMYTTENDQNNMKNTSDVSLNEVVIYLIISGVLFT